MPKLKEICRYIRSKNAGPFWITVDLFFDGEENYQQYRNSNALSPGLFVDLFGIEARFVKRVPVDSLRMIKISFPRPHPQGWMGERDMHSGQQFARLLDVDIS